jgi:hypothetical protein
MDGADRMHALTTCSRLELHRSRKETDVMIKRGRGGQVHPATYVLSSGHALVLRAKFDVRKWGADSSGYVLSSGYVTSFESQVRKWGADSSGYVLSSGYVTSFESH